MTGPDPYDYARRLAADSLASGDPTGWFERIYADAEAGKALLPWGGTPHRLLVEWAQTRHVEGRGRRALVVGCGLGEDAEYIARLGFDTLAFDVARTAIRAARRRFPNSTVRYVVADLLNPPLAWQHRFDLVVEVFTIQVLPSPERRQAISRMGHLVCRGGTLILIARAAEDHNDRHPPWPITRAEIEAFTSTGLRPIRIERLHDGNAPAVRRWRAEFARPPHPDLPTAIPSGPPEQR